MGFLSRKKEPLDKSGLKSSLSVSAPVAAPANGTFLQTTKPSEKTNRRISTIEDDPHPLSSDNYSDSMTDDSQSEDDADSDYEIHSHPIFERDKSINASQLLTLMSLCGLSLLAALQETIQKAANEELKRTFSLLSDHLKIVRLLSTMNKADLALYESVIGDHQLKMIKSFTSTLTEFINQKGNLTAQYQMARPMKTLAERYGRVTEVLGRGAYGVIKIINSDDGNKNGLYAVKELERRPASEHKVTETAQQFVERVISEFIVSSALNNKNIVRTVDFLLTLPPLATLTCAVDLFDKMKISQVMECAPGGDLFSYVKKLATKQHYILIDEIDCVVKQVSKGLWYMHNHGVAHCDLKLENVLVCYEEPKSATGTSPITFKISDFGKANVFRTIWDKTDQLCTSGPVGLELYMAPEEFVSGKKGFSYAQKDCWSLGIIILFLYNLRRSLIIGTSGNLCSLEYFDEEHGEEDTKAYSLTYLWKSTEPKEGFSRRRKYKDEVFNEYTQTRMSADYNRQTKEWTIQRKGSFVPIETLFETQHAKHEVIESDLDYEQDDFDLRKYFIYKLLDVDPKTRISAETLLKGDWLGSVELCTS